VQSILRVVNIVLGPVLTLIFAAWFDGVTLAGRDAGDVLGGAAAGLVVLAAEIALTQGPKYSAWMRRWLDPRAAFEGVWFQDVFSGQRGNEVGLYFLDYLREGDSFAVVGHAYSSDGRVYAKWTSTHMFIDEDRLRSTYLWEGELLEGRRTPEVEKTGLTHMELRRPPVFALPMTGDGRVSHVGEGTRVEFKLHRITNRRLRELGLPFGIRQLRINARDEEAQLVKALLPLRSRHVENGSAVRA
jgi:hypothetical protein